MPISTAGSQTSFNSPCSATGPALASSTASSPCCPQSNIQTQARSIASPRPKSSVSQGRCGQAADSSGRLVRAGCCESSNRTTVAPGRRSFNSRPTAAASHVAQPNGFLQRQAIFAVELELRQVIQRRELANVGRQTRPQADRLASPRLACAAQSTDSAAQGFVAAHRSGL